MPDEKMTDIKVDTENMCIDRSTPEGQLFAKLCGEAKQQEDPRMRTFMDKMLAFTEAALVISKTMKGEEAEAALEALRAEMENPKV